jgi:acyl carrier protein
MKISRSDFISIVQENVGSTIKISDIKLEDRLVDIGIDSLAFATVLWALEDRFKIQVDDSYLQNLNSLSTVNDLVALFKSLGHEIDIESTVS